ncbi:hypothetical protein KIW84_032466 [Lathyrus oleraceus]|uniref:Aminotransferase-like plant mobile domain-containing protein n=1 Tax=Pisum sativum TaxID=3888 RepID=A0A9D4XTC3_PEA|nr:hypothetical protein KIW84_032466 [Pisum sativum]
MSLLTMGDEHRGTLENISTFDPKHFRGRVHEYVPHDPLIEPYIRGCGFGNLLNIVSYSVDYKFILDLLERWRLETHTFHLPIDECIVTSMWLVKNVVTRPDKREPIHVLFIWRPYMGVDHDVNHDDAAIWTTKTSIIRFTMVEMHQSGRVKLQFDMQQQIPEPPTCLGNWHQKRVDVQWDYSDSKRLCKSGVSSVTPR